MRYRKSFVFGLFMVLVMGIAAGCASLDPLTVQVKHDEPLQDDTPADQLLAGMARIDITPPPGIAMAGYSAMAHKGKGFRNRLYARAIYIRSADGTAVALVQSDLLSGSRLLHHRVAELIADKTDVPARGLMLAGTHTHSAPGHFFGSNFYNKFASSEKGLDLKLYQFLSTRVAEAVEKAYKEKRPARIAAGVTRIYGQTRNRSMAACRANYEASEKAPSDPKKAVNPEFCMLRVDLLDKDGNYKPAGAFSCFSVHPTAVPYSNDLYNADVFGYIARELEYTINTRDRTPWRFVHAVVNGTHGDNSPDYKPGCQGFAEAKRVGRAIAGRAVSLFNSLEDDLQAGVPVRAACREVDLYQNPAIDGVSVCSRPVVGNALTAGAEDGKTPVLRWLPFFREGWASARWFFTGSCQGHKRHLGSIFQPLILPRQDFPYHLFFQTIQIGKTTLLPLPFEMTWQAGQGVRQEVFRVLPGEDYRCQVISCANGYFGYATTPAEYACQHYEGGHTLYGPQTSLFLGKHAASLAADMINGVECRLPEKWTFQLESTTFFPEKKPPLGQRREVSAPVFSPGKKNREDCWRFQWRDVGPGLIAFHRPLVYMETSPDGESWKRLKKDGRPVNDRGYDMAVCFCKRVDNQNMGIYEARWYNPEIPAGQVFRFGVLPRQGKEFFYSSTFPKNKTGCAEAAGSSEM